MEAFLGWQLCQRARFAEYADEDETVDEEFAASYDELLLILGESYLRSAVGTSGELVAVLKDGMTFVYDKDTELLKCNATIYVLSSRKASAFMDWNRKTALRRQVTRR